MTAADDLDDTIEEEDFHLVKFSGSLEDLEFNLSRAIELVEGLDPAQSDYSLDQIIEFYNILLFIEADSHLKSWSRSRRKQFAGAGSSLKPIVDRYFGSISPDNFLDETIEFERIYHGDFLDLFAAYKLADVIPQKQFGDMAYSNEIALIHLLGNEYIVANYGGFVRRALLDSPENAKLLIWVAGNSNDLRYGKLHIPTCLAAADQAKLITQYINSRLAFPGDLELIANGGLADIGIATRTRIKARKQLAAIRKKLDHKLPKPSVSFEFKIDPDQDQILVEDVSGQTARLSLSAKHLAGDTSPKAIIKNLVNLFELVDRKFRIALCGKPTTEDLFREVLRLNSAGPPGVDTYPDKSAVFVAKADLTNAGLREYNDFLGDRGKSLEGALSDFYNSQLPEHCGIDSFEVELPANQPTSPEKCRQALGVIELIIKRYRLHVASQFDDVGPTLPFGLPEISSPPTLCRPKYLYLNHDNDEVDRILYNLFTDALVTGHHDDPDVAQAGLYALIYQGSVDYQQFEGSSRIEIDHLIDLGLLTKKSDLISLKDCPLSSLIADLHFNTAVSYPQLDGAFKKQAYTLIDKGWLRFDLSLLSEPESDYFDYHLVSGSFSNSLDLKNGYDEGGALAGSSDNAIHDNNYITILKLLILLTIKIIDDLAHAPSQQ